ncbi:hypothetical protein Plec18167_008175 [Paecilomyces lecythidis]|uniref:Uncharacterized protein n=1 Tax=Paecilomyces lecythidis TaxID=3004212 RepID=A0ABR3WY19_9EURO
MADEPQVVCRICGVPLEDGPVTYMYELCPTHFDRERWNRRLKLLRTDAPLTKGGSQAASGPVPNPQPVEAAGGDNTDGAPKPAEKSPVPAKGQKGILPSAANSTEGQKLGPACGPCKRAKIRCKHRLVLDDASNVSPSKKRKRDAETQVGVAADKQKDADNNDVSVVGVEAEAPPPAKRARKAQQKEGGAVSSETKPSLEAGSVADPAKRQTRGSLKRKREAEEPQADSKAADAAGATTATVREENQPPVKRSRRARKPTQSVAFADPVVSVSTVQTVTPAAAPERRYLAPFPVDNLGGSARIAYHRVQSQRFEALVEEANSKWVAAMEAFQAVKDHLDGWADQWARGE